MDPVDADVTEDPSYVSCMFCTARCFKLHGHGVNGSKGCASTSSPPHERPPAARPAGVKGVSTSRKHRAPFFVKTVKLTTVRRKNCELHLPAFFFKDYGDRFQKFVLLQGPSGQVWPVNLCVSCGSTSGRPTVRFSRGWKEFAADHYLELGDKLIFTLVSFSRFSVQVFDLVGKKKPTSSKAVSGWSFRREDQVDGEIPKQKKSIFVNWQNKVVRESSIGSGNEKSKKGKMPTLYNHVRRDDKKLEKRNALVAKFRSRKPDKSLPLFLLGEKWGNQSGSTSSSDSEEIINFNSGNGDMTALLDGKLVEWEPLQNTSPVQTWPLALNSNDSSKALVTTQQLNSAGNLRTKPMNLSIAASPGPPPLRNPHVLENREQGKGNYSTSSDQQEEEDPLQAYWKDNEQTSNSLVWSTANRDRNAKPTTRSHVLNVRPISALESPHEVDTVYTPSSPTLSLSHYLEESSSEAVQSCNDRERNLTPTQSQQRFRFPDQRTVKRNHIEQRGEGCADGPMLGSEDLAPQSCQAHSMTQVRGIVNSSRQTHVRVEESTRWNCSLPDGNRACSNGLNPLRISFQTENNVSRQNFDCDSQFGTRNPSRTPQNISNATPTRSDLSLAYFLNQPPPIVRRQNQEEAGASASQSLGGKYTNAKGTSGSEIDRVQATVGISLPKCQNITAISGEMPSRAISVQKCLDVRASDKLHGCLGEQTRGVTTAGLASPYQTQCPAELLAIKTARCYVDEDFNIRTTSPESRELPSACPASDSPLVALKSSVREVSFSDELDHLHEKELALTCKRGGREDLQSPTKKFRSEYRAAGVLTECNPNHQKIPTPSLCTISPPTSDHKSTPACRKAVGITEYLEQKRVARKARPRLKKKAGLGAGSIAASQKDDCIMEDIKPLVNASSNCQVASASNTVRGHMNDSDSRASTPREELKVRKLGGMYNLMEQTPIPRMRISSDNRCDLVELDGITSDEDDPAGGDLFEVEESWDTWMEIIRKRDNAASSHHLRTPLRLKPR